MSTTLGRGQKLEPPTMPGGQLVLQAPPELAPHEGAGGALMMALPMLGSVGSIVFVAAAPPGGKGMIAAAMFLVATLGFVGVSVDRQRKQRSAKVGGARREYLQYLAGIRKVVRETATQQRRSLLWHHPAPASLPALAEDRSRLWERTPESPHHLQVRYGLTAQPLALELVPPETAPIEQLDPVAASALHRLLVVHRVQPDLPAALDLRAFSRVEVTGEAEHARALARALVCSVSAFHSPDDLVVAVLANDETLPAWEWLKWLPHAHSTEDSDALGPSRMVTTSVDDLAAMLPRDLVDRPRFGADQRPAVPHVLVVVDGGHLPPGNHLIPDEGVHGVTVLDLPERWAELDDPTRLRLNIEPALLPDGRAAVTALRVREVASRAAGDQLDLATAEAFARRLAPLHTTEGPVREDSLAGTPDLNDLLGLSDVRSFDLASAWQPRPARDRLRVPIGVGDDGAPVELDIKESAQEGMGPHGLLIGATGSGKSELLRTLVLGAGRDALLRDAQLRARRLQGRRDLRRALGQLPHVVGRDHQPRGRAHRWSTAWRTRISGGDGPPPGAAARGRQLRLGPRLREGPRRRRRRSPRCPACSSSSTSSPNCSRASRTSSTCSCRSAGSAGRSACTCCWPRSAWRRAGSAAWTPTCRTGSGCAPSPRGVADGARRAGRLRAAAGAGPRLPEVGPVDAAPVQGRVRLGAAAAARRRDGRPLGGPGPRDPAVHGRPRPRSPRGGAGGAGGRPHQPRGGRHPLRAGHRCRPDARARPRGAPGLAPAARRAGHPGRPHAGPRRGPRAGSGLAVVAGARRSRRTPGDRGPPARAAP